MTPVLATLVDMGKTSFKDFHGQKNYDIYDQYVSSGFQCAVR